MAGSVALPGVRPLFVEHVTIENSAGPGVVLAETTGFAEGSTDLTITGETAASLGILTNAPTSGAITGADLGVRLTPTTLVEDLNGGTGLTLDGIVITNGALTQTLDLSAAETVQDVLNIINTAGLYVRAEINPAGTGLDVLNLVSGTTLSITEDSGSTAADLGIRSLDANTELATLNFGRGLNIDPDQADLRIIARDGGIVDVSAAFDDVPYRTAADRMPRVLAAFDGRRHRVEALAASGASEPAGALQAPVPRPAKLIAAFGNYREGTGRERHTQDMFLESPDSVIGPGGTVVLPDATVKLYVTADPMTRASRRVAELQARGGTESLDEVLADLLRRDARDAGRTVAPLTRAADAYLLDTTEMDIESAFRAAVDIVERTRAERE